MRAYFLDRVIGKVIAKIVWEGRGLEEIQFTDGSCLTLFIADESYLSFRLDYTPPIHEWIEAEYMRSPEERQSDQEQPWRAIG